MDARRMEVAELLAGYLGEVLNDTVESSSPSALDAVERDDFKQGLVDVCDACRVLAAQAEDGRSVAALASEYLKSARVGYAASQFEDGSFDLAIGRPEWVVREVRKRSYPALPLWRDRTEFGALYLVAVGLVAVLDESYDVGPAGIVEQLTQLS